MQAMMEPVSLGKSQCANDWLDPVTNVVARNTSDTIAHIA